MKIVDEVNKKKRAFVSVCFLIQRFQLLECFCQFRGRWRKLTNGLNPFWDSFLLDREKEDKPKPNSMSLRPFWLRSIFYFMGNMMMTIYCVARSSSLFRSDAKTIGYFDQQCLKGNQLFSQAYDFDTLPKDLQQSATERLFDNGRKLLAELIQLNSLEILQESELIKSLFPSKREQIPLSAVEVRWSYMLLWVVLVTSLTRFSESVMPLSSNAFEVLSTWQKAHCAGNQLIEEFNTNMVLIFNWKWFLPRS